MTVDRQRADSAAAFRRFAALGLHRTSSPIELLCRVRGVCRDDEALTMLAVGDTVRLLEFSGQSETARAVRAVYFTSRRSRPRASEVSGKIRRFAAEHHMDDRTVYRRLATARKLFSFIRAEYSTCGFDVGDRGSLAPLVATEQARR